jgi:hypothetical protein
VTVNYAQTQTANYSAIVEPANPATASACSAGGYFMSDAGTTFASLYCGGTFTTGISTVYEWVLQTLGP